MNAINSGNERKFFRWPLLVFISLFSLTIFATCGGGGSESSFNGGGIGGTGKSIGTITAKGSIFVNGIEFETTSANIDVDDSTGTEDDLKVGMIAKVSGTFNSDDLTGSADEIEVENEVQGEIISFGPEVDSFTVLSQKIFVDGNTAYANVSGLAGLNVGDDVEVHGQRDEMSRIRATRVELLSGSGTIDELKGIVTSLDTTTAFRIGTQYVESASALISPGGVATRADIAVGVLVEVHGNISGSHPTFGPIFLATRVDIEDLEDAIFDPDEGDEFEVEGFITEFDSPGDTLFEVNGREVQLAADVRFEGGLPGDMRNGVKVEAEGHTITGGVLIVDHIKFKDSIRIESNPTNITATSFTVLGKTVLIKDTTDQGDFVGDPNEGVKVRGFENDDGTITATELDETNPVDTDKQILQGPVDSFNRTLRTVVILGITVDASGPGIEFEDDQDDEGTSGDQPITADQFFDFLENATGTVVVKARGTFNSGTNTIVAEKLEIE